MSITSDSTKNKSYGKNFALNKSYFSYSKPIDKNILKLCEDVSLEPCFCGGQPQFILRSPNQPDALVKCTDCNTKTQFHSSPAIAGQYWNQACLSSDKLTSLSISASQPVRISLFNELVARFNGVQVRRCGCGGEVSLIASDHLKGYCVCKCDNCEHETELSIDANAAIALWNTQS